MIKNMKNYYESTKLNEDIKAIDYYNLISIKQKIGKNNE